MDGALKAAIQEKYGKAATAARDGSACCGRTCGDPITSHLYGDYGDAETAHRPAEAVAAVTGTAAEKQRAFDATARQLLARLRLWLSLPGIRTRIESHA